MIKDFSTLFCVSLLRAIYEAHEVNVCFAVDFSRHWIKILGN